MGAAGGAADPARIDPARLVRGRHVVGVLLTLFGVGRGRVRDLVVAVVVARRRSILIVHARHSSRLIRAGAPRRGDGPRCCCRDRAEAGQGSRARRSNGRVQDVRLPLEDGQPIQILTTRDTEDPDALYVLRHSAAHLLAEAVRRLYPGTKIAIGPPIENGFYYDFEFPEPIGEEALEKIEAEIQRELKEGRSWERQEVAADEAKRLFAEQGEDYKVELVDTAEGDISLYTQGDFTDLCRGPHLQDSKPIKAIKLTGLAGAYWRGDENNTQLTRIYGTAFYSQADLDAYLERIEEARSETTGGSRGSSTSSTSPTTRRGCRSGTRRGW